VWAAQQYCKECLGTPKHQHIAKCASIQLAFWRGCGECLVLMTAEGANRPPKQQGGQPAWMRCKYCAEEGLPKASQWEEQALELVRHLLGDGWLANESCMLGQRYGATDLLFKAKVGGKWCGVEADGEAHFERPWRGSSQLRRVRQDREKDEAYLSRAQPVVRLHYQDTVHWRAVLERARELALLPQLHTFILYTPSYPEDECCNLVQYTCGTVEYPTFDQVGGCGGLTG